MGEIARSKSRIASDLKTRDSNRWRPCDLKLRFETRDWRFVLNIPIQQNCEKGCDLRPRSKIASDWRLAIGDFAHLRTRILTKMGEIHMNFSFWPFLWFGLPGRLLKCTCSTPWSATGLPKDPSILKTPRHSIPLCFTTAVVFYYFCSDLLLYFPLKIVVSKCLP